jgi:thiol:disulfide interchange protein DsbD
LPESVTTRASQVGGGGWAGAFIVGTVAGVVAAPCTGPVVAYLLLEIANHPEWSSTAGVLVMLAYSLGLGMLFLAIGTFAGILASLPRSGTWMLAVKQLFGTVLVGAALFYFDKALASAYGGRHLIPEAWNISVLVGWGAVALSLSIIVAGGRALLGAGRSVPRMMAGAGVAALSLVLLRPEAHAGVIWVRDHLEGLSAARAAGRPAIVDFTADWCAACKELEHFTYTDPAVVQCAAEFVPIMVDGTRESAEFDALRKEYGFKGLPAVYFVCPDGRVVRDLTLRGFEPADRFLAKMNVALATCREGSLASARPGEQPS